MLRFLLLFLCFTTTYAACGDGTANYPAPDNGHVTIPEGVTEIPDDEYKDCTALTSITFPSTLHTIGENAFREANIAGDLILPEGLTSIGKLSFWNNPDMTSVTVPSSVTTVGNQPFGVHPASNYYFHVYWNAAGLSIGYGFIAGRNIGFWHFAASPTCSVSDHNCDVLKGEYNSKCSC